MVTARFDWGAAGGGAIYGGLYGIVLGVFALGAAGAGHGSYMPFAVFGAPLSLVPMPLGLLGVLLVWPLGGLIMAGAARRWWSVTVLSIHAAAVLVTLLIGNPAESVDEQWEYLSYALRSTGPWIPAGVLIYLVGQLAAWSLVIRSRSEAQSAG